jgi:hypothetical protein
VCEDGKLVVRPTNTYNRGGYSQAAKK